MRNEIFLAMMRGRTTESLDGAVKKVFGDMANIGGTGPTLYLMPSAAYTGPISD